MPYSIGSVKRLVLIPIAVAALVGSGLFPPEPLQVLFFQWAPVAVSLFAAVGAAVAAGQFAPGDRLFAPWAGFSFASTLMALNSVLVVCFELSKVGRYAFNIAINFTLVLSLWLFVRAWKKSGLALPMSRAREMVWIISGIAAALIVGGYPLLRGLATANVSATLLISTAGDIAAIALIVPIALPAFAMRGGVVMYVWLYLACNEVGWILFDIFHAVAPSLGIAPSELALCSHMLSALAVSFLAVAGFAQRMATAKPRAVRFDPNAESSSGRATSL